MIEDYTEQSDGQKALISGRYAFAQAYIKTEYEGVNCSTWLDIGTNLGIGLSEIEPTSNLVVSDICLEYLKKIEGSKFPRVNFDMVAIPFGSELFDVITSFETIEHMSLVDVIKGIEEMHRVLKRNGLLIISTPNRIANGNRKMSTDHKFEFSPDELKSLLMDLGFEVQEEYGQNFIQQHNLTHRLFLEFRRSSFIRSMYYRLPRVLINNIRDCSLATFGSGEVRKQKNDNELERVIYLVCRKAI